LTELINNTKTQQDASIETNHTVSARYCHSTGKRLGIIIFAKENDLMALGQDNGHLD
jgi:hypothetical protein